VSHRILTKRQLCHNRDAGLPSSHHVRAALSRRQPCAAPRLDSEGRIHHNKATGFEEQA
ncbi:unnamed protein product, partial [Acidocella sp. C78]